MRVRLEIEDSYDFRLIGISCHEKDYRLVWGLNQFSGFRLERKEDLKQESGKNNFAHFPLYEETDEDQFRTYQLLANRFESNYFLPELATIDFLFFVRAEIDREEIDELAERIHRVEFVILASELDISKIRQKENLLFF